jgi:hypothetical protein
LIHIDSRERDFNKIRNCNPFSIQMNTKISCLVSVRDLVISNIYSDPYLLVQIVESNKGVYENQVNNDVHFKLVRVESSRESSYYKNISPQTMVRLRDIMSITFKILRPNGKVLYSSVKDLYDIKVETIEDAKAYIESNSIMSEMSNRMELISMENVADLNVEEGEYINLFDKLLEDGMDYKILHMNKKENKILVESVESRNGTSFSKLMINKYQMAITLEII